MPRGHHSKDAPPEFGYDLNRLNKSMDYTMNDELMRKGSEARKRILDGFEDTLTKIKELGDGIIVHETLRTPEGKPGPVCYNCGQPITERVYRVPPYWPALRWLGEWGRLITREDAPDRRVQHDYPPEVLEAMRQYVHMDKGNGHVSLLPSRSEGGAINLEDEDA